MSISLTSMSCIFAAFGDCFIYVPTNTNNIYKTIPCCNFLFIANFPRFRYYSHYKINQKA
jgi:hypothetical protein